MLERNQRWSLASTQRRARLEGSFDERQSASASQMDRANEQAAGMHTHFLVHTSRVPSHIKRHSTAERPARITCGLVISADVSLTVPVCWPSLMSPRVSCREHSPPSPFLSGERTDSYSSKPIVVVVAHRTQCTKVNFLVALLKNLESANLAVKVTYSWT